jgi:hypothetical protein
VQNVLHFIVAKAVTGGPATDILLLGITEFCEIPAVNPGLSYERSQSANLADDFHQPLTKY